MTKMSFPPKKLVFDISFLGLSCVLIALLSIACDKISSLLNPHANVVLEGEIIVKEQWSYYVHYLGKVKNIGNADAKWIRVIIETYGKDNKLTGVDSGSTEPSSLAPGEIGAFDIGTSVKCEDYDHYEYKIDWSE